tara:strand:- start:1018 stop:1185 length:168 start_codon:yes stop_codon:yes gene_type:complete
MKKSIDRNLFGELKRNKRERFQEFMGELMVSIVLMLFFGILIYAPWMVSIIWEGK